YAMSIKRLFDAVERRGDIGRRVAALVLPISNRARVTSGCAGKVDLREPGEHTSGPNLASRDNAAHNRTLYDSGNAATCSSGALRPLCAYKSKYCWPLSSKPSEAQAPAIAMPFFIQVPCGLSKKNAAAIPPMTIPAPTLFQNEAANLIRSLRCNSESLPK